MDKPSLRQIAKELDISTAYLSYMVNGKRPWRKDLYQRYMGVVNTFVNSDGPSVNEKESANSVSGTIDGAGEEIRTLDVLLGNYWSVLQIRKEQKIDVKSR